MKMQKMKNGFKKFWAFAGEPIDSKRFWFGFVVSVVFVVIFLLSGWELLDCRKDQPTYFITLIAFLAAAYAIWKQHKDGIRQEERHKEALTQQDDLLKEQKEAGIKQEIVGAWQIIGRKAAGNSGKIEAIQ